MFLQIRILSVLFYNQFYQLNISYYMVMDYYIYEHYFCNKEEKKGYMVRRLRDANRREEEKLAEKEENGQ